MRIRTSRLGIGASLNVALPRFRIGFLGGGGPWWLLCLGPLARLYPSFRIVSLRFSILLYSGLLRNWTRCAASFLVNHISCRFLFRWGLSFWASTCRTYVRRGWVSTGMPSTSTSPGQDTTPRKRACRDDQRASGGAVEATREFDSPLDEVCRCCGQL